MTSDRNLKTRVLRPVRSALTLAVLSALLLIAARPAHAQTETVLYNFTGGSDGGGPQSRLTFDRAGNLYGTTYAGGRLGYGTVFELSPNGSGGWKETVLYSFTGGADGRLPWSYVMFDRKGNLYGTTEAGGTSAYGTVFELSPVGTSWTETVLYSFAGGAGGALPENGLIMDAAGNLYGTTQGGSVGGGVFELRPSGGGWTEQAIYAANPSYYWMTAALTMDAAGNIFGASGSTVFELSPNGNGGWNPTVIHTFTGYPEDGIGAEGTPVLDPSGNLYGTTLYGGAEQYGTVYKLSHGEDGEWTEGILYSFKGAQDGAFPWGGIVLDAAGNIYGTTGGKGMYGCGTVFELVAPVGTGSYEEKVLWSFNGTDGSYLFDSLIPDSAGNLYGTASSGGSSNAGLVFELTRAAVTATTLVSSLNPSIYGQAVTWRATVTSSGSITPTGRVRFTWSGYTIGWGTLNTSGVATLTRSNLNADPYPLTAVYAGDTNNLGSTSSVLNQRVLPTTSAATITSSLNPSSLGQPVTFTAQIISPTVMPTGPVTFKAGTTVLGTAQLNGGKATFTTSALAAGSTMVTATYYGDSNIAKSSASVTQTVHQ